MSDDKRKYQAILTAIGWQLQKGKEQTLLECPFCGKEKLYVSNRTTQWDCKVCHKKGNAITALTEMFENVYRPALDRRLRTRLAEYRKMPSSKYLLGSRNLGYDVEGGRYVWAIRNPAGNVVTLRHFTMPRKGRRGSVRAIKGVGLGLLGAEQLGDESRKEEVVYLCEGEWDYHAFNWVLRVTESTGIVVAVPGSGVLPAQWAEWLRGRNVVVLYDHDDPGREGTVRCYLRMKSVVEKLRFLHWEEDTKDGYDVSDLVRENVENADEIIPHILEHLEDKPTGELPQQDGVVQQTDRRDTQEDLDPISVEELHATFDKWLHLANHDLVDVVMGTLWTLHLPGNPIWMFLIAPPSASKSELLMPVSHWWKCHAISNMTSRSLVSGFQGPGGSDPSLLSSLNNTRTSLVIKDLTPLLKGRPEERDEVFGILRDAYDGSVTKVFGNGLRRTYDSLHFVILAGVTPVVDSSADVACGERFLRFRADRDLDRGDDVERAIRAVTNCGQEETMRAELREACVRSLIRPFDPTKVPSIGRKEAELFAKLAQLTARLRAVAPVERGSDRQTMAPMAEAPPRLATQFAKLAQGLALHLECDKVDDSRVFSLLRRVAMHTIDAVPMNVFVAAYYLYKSGEENFSVSDVKFEVGRFGSETVRETIIRYVRVGVMAQVETGDARNRRYRISEPVLKLLEETEAFGSLPPVDVYYRKRWAKVMGWEVGRSRPASRPAVRVKAKRRRRKRTS